MSASKAPVAPVHPAIEPQADSFEPLPNLTPAGLRFAQAFSQLDAEDQEYYTAQILKRRKLS